MSISACPIPRPRSRSPRSRSAPDYPQYLHGNPPLVPGDTVPPFTIAAQDDRVLHDWSEVAPRLVVCKGIEANGDAFADSGTFQFTVAVKGQAPFQTVSVAPFEDDEDKRAPTSTWRMCRLRYP